MDVGIFYGEIIFKKKELLSYVGVLITPEFFTINDIYSFGLYNVRKYEKK